MAKKLFQKGNPGKPKGAKTKLSESFYADCLVLYEEMGIGGLRAFVNKCPRNKEIFYNWLAKWAEKQIKQSLEVAGEGGGPLQVHLTKTVTVIKPKDYAGE